MDIAGDASFEQTNRLEDSSEIKRKHNDISGNRSVRDDYIAKKRDVKFAEHEDKSVVDADTFLFLSPVDPLEVEEISKKVRIELDEALDVISNESYEAYRRKKTRSHAELEVGGGMDTDDEENEKDRKLKEEAATLDEAVIRGNPRGYQTALFELTKRRNIIVNLGTGQGKTLIALLCIRHMASPAFENGKQTLFLVPSIALAVQHTTTLNANLPFTVATACNTCTKSAKAREELAEANIIVATHGAAKDLFMHYGDMFCLSRINLLVVDGEHGYATILKNFYHRLPKESRPKILGLTASPLVNVKKDIDDGKLDAMLQELETCLDAQLACFSRLGPQTQIAKRKDLSSEYKNNENGLGFISSNVQERSIHYNSDNFYQDLPDYENIGMHESRIKEFNQLRALYEELGPRLVSIYANTLSREVSRNRYDQETNDQFQRVVAHLKLISEFCNNISESCPDGGRTEKLAILEELLEEVIEGKGSDNTVGVVFVDRRITALALYDYFRARSKGLKVNTWVRVADTQWSRKFKKNELNTIVKTSSDTEKNEKKKKNSFDINSTQFEDFDIEMEDLDNTMIHNVVNDTLPIGMNVENINTSTALAHEVIPHQANEDFKKSCSSTKVRSSSIINPNKTIRCDMLVRHTTQIFKYLDKSHHFSQEEEKLIQDTWLHQMKKIRDVLDGLRTKRTNVLIATSVVEEGVDVDACSFVIVFDNLKSTKAYVQMKGRARQKDAKFYVFQNEATKCNKRQHMNLKTAQEIEHRVRLFIESRRPSKDPDSYCPALKFRKYDGLSMNAEEQAIVEGEYRAPSGMVDLSSARSLLNRYTLCIPMDASSRSTRDVLLLHMPAFEDNRLLLPSHLPSEIRCVVLPDQYHTCTKKDKQNMLALMACARLHQLNLLNDRLLPLQRKDMQMRLLDVALTELASSGEPPAQKSPPLHNKANKVYIYPLYQKGKMFQQNEKALKGNGRILCIICLVPFPSNLPTLRFTHPEIGKITCNLGVPTTAKLNSTEWTVCANFYTAVMNARWRRRTGTAFYKYVPENVKSNVLPSYVIGCLTKEGKLDWTRMRNTLDNFARTEEEKIKAVSSASTSNDLSDARIWCPIYDPNVSYIAYGPSRLTCDAKFPDTQDDVKTYQDYMVKKRGFQVDAKSKLFAVQRLWHLPRKVHKEFANLAFFDKWKKKNLETELEVSPTILQDGERSPCDGLVAALLPHDACLEAPIPDASLFLHCLILPQILYHMDQINTAQAFVSHCLEHLPKLGSYLQKISKDSLDDILEATTARSCAMGINYDRLEYLGDAVLKMVHTDALLNSRDLRKWVGFLHEGDLTLLRSAMGSNKRLMTAAKSAGLDRYILVKQLGRGQWVPIGLELHSVDEKGIEELAKSEEVVPGKKVCADVVESLLGLIFIFYGLEAAFTVCSEMGITLPRDDDWVSTVTNYKPKQRLIDLSKKFLGNYEFKRQELMEEAFTHPSCIHEVVPCYQRLEWVGDAVLCIFSRQWAFENYPKLHVAELVIIEATIVCNETLAYISMRNRLHQHLNHRDMSLPSRIENFEFGLKTNGRGLWATDPPKCLPDMVEAAFGAVHADAGFLRGQQIVAFVLSPITKALARSLLSNDDEDIRDKARTMMHPKQFVHEMAGGIIQVKAWREEVFALRQVQCPVWRTNYWGVGEKEGNGAIGVLESFGIDIVAIAESSSHVARNRACAVAMEVFVANPDLIEKLRTISLLLREERQENQKEVDESTTSKV